MATGRIGERYATQVGVLWSGLARTLTELDQLAADPFDLDSGDVEMIRRLQYRLHRASEDALALAPPADVEPVHNELAGALVAARDATAEMVDALEEDGIDAALPGVYEWRGALFRVRLARLALAPSREPEPERLPAARDIRKPLEATLLVLAGIGAFTGGAVVGWWPLWAAGLLAVCGSFLAYKP